MARPSRLVRESATTMRYCGLRILPIRRSRILTATVFFAPDDYMGEPTEPTWGCGTDVSWTGNALRVRGRLTRAGYQSSILPDRSPHLPIGPGSRSETARPRGYRTVPAGGKVGRRYPLGGRDPVGPGAVERERARLDLLDHPPALVADGVLVGHPVMLRKGEPLGELVL